MNKKHGRSSKKSVIIARAMVFIILILISGLILYMYVVDRVRYTEERSITDYTEVQFERVWSELQILRGQAHDNAHFVAEKIEADLRTQDLDEIKEDMDNRVINDVMYEIIKYHISDKSMNKIDNSRNGIVIMTQDGILEDFNYERVPSSDKQYLRTWDDEINNAYNKNLEKEFIHRLLTQSNSIIATERSNCLGEDHIKIDSMDYDSLKDIFMKEGIDGLKNYQFLCPVYITETGDIFGQNDIIQGVRQATHKIIVVQEFNLYDQLSKMESALLNMDDHISYIREDYSTTISIVYVMGLFYVASAISLLFYFSHLYNYYIGLYKENNDIVEESNTDRIIREYDRIQKEINEKKSRKRSSKENPDNKN